jgi:plastocyanin
MSMGNRFTLCLFAGTLVLGACGGSDQLSQKGTTSPPSTEPPVTTSSTVGGEAPAFEEADADAVLEYSLVDYRFEGPEEVAGHKIFFKAVNNGTEDHELEVLDASGEPLGEVEAMPPDEEGSAAIELEAGTYTLQCILETADGKVHRDLGMVAELVVE